MDKLTRKACESVLHLAFKYPWLKPKTDALMTLLFEDCETDDQAQLIIDILDQLKYITMHEYNSYLSDLALDIATCGIEPESSFIVAMSADSKADSGQSVLYDLKNELSKIEWKGYRSVNRYDQTPKAYKEFKTSKGAQTINIVLVDNFVGSGSTVINRVKRIEELFNQSGFPKPNIYVKVLISTISGKDNINSEDINFSFFSLVNDKLLERIYEPDQVEVKKDLMRSLESKLAPSYNERVLPSLGYGESQVAISIENKNTPNNVFPILWWKYYSDQRVRNVLLHRAMDDA
ncbi:MULTISPECIES: hypothetical protein [Acinetobacter calcoaceticus/baumannii complex]|uniref:PRTase-CE domain-containing protein n=1 Tax=Acinetobacter pittii ANC 4050 TaxID=1217691 RepID=R8Y8N7_ACIPI|nr:MULTISPECIES: hypothetical protein [Acinetobacter calcoaceticus/baumannii complex]EOQ65763.1 hypothetical protein F931_03556 [Acinetobacter pittii ANC 4050]